MTGSESHYLHTNTILENFAAIPLTGHIKAHKIIIACREAVCLFDNFMTFARFKVNHERKLRCDSKI